MCNTIEIIDFFRPEGGRKNLFLTNITENATKDVIQETLYQDFSTFGVIFEIQVFPLYGKTSNTATCAPDSTRTGVSRNVSASSESSHTCSMSEPGLPTGWYAFVKFYSAIAAGKAKAFLNGKLLLGQPYKIAYAKRRALIDVKPPVLYITKCQELANHYLGFNGWSSSLRSMINDSDLSPPTPKVHYIASARVDITKHGLHSEGVGMGEGFLNPQDPASKGEVIGRVKKVAYQNALENAFSKLVLIVFANGKVTVEVNTTMVDILLKKAQIEESELLKINELFDEPESEEAVLLDEDKPETDIPEHPTRTVHATADENMDILTVSIIDDMNRHILQELEECT